MSLCCFRESCSGLHIKILYAQTFIFMKLMSGDSISLFILHYSDFKEIAYFHIHLIGYQQLLSMHCLVKCIVLLENWAIYFEFIDLQDLCLSIFFTFLLLIYLFLIGRYFRYNFAFVFAICYHESAIETGVILPFLKIFYLCGILSCRNFKCII